MAQLGNTIINGNLVVSGTVTIEGSIDASIDEAVKAERDLAGRIINETYGASISIKNSVLSLKSPDGVTLSSVLISTADTLQAISENGATTNRALTITNATDATSTATGALKVTGGIGVGGTVWATKVIGGWWNDYAEQREIKPVDDELLLPGTVVGENGDDTLSITSFRMQPGAKVLTDTFGMCIGERTLFTRPIAVAGRVLVRTLEPRNMFKLHTGEAVCAAQDGTVSLMTRKEIQDYPDRILGYVVSVPDYLYWGKAQTPVDGRIWISLK